MTHRAWGSLCSLLLWLPTVLPSGSPTVCAGVWLLSALTCRLRIPTRVPALGPIPSVHCMVPSDLVDDKQLMAGSWNWVGLKVPCNSNHSMILWILRPSWHPAGWTWTQQPRRLNSSAAISLQIIYIIMLLAHKGRKFSNIPSTNKFRSTMPGLGWASTSGSDRHFGIWFGSKYSGGFAQGGAGKEETKGKHILKARLLSSQSYSLLGFSSSFSHPPPLLILHLCWKTGTCLGGVRSHFKFNCLRIVPV